MCDHIAGKARQIIDEATPPVALNGAADGATDDAGNNA
jgi:hypothetical protein